MKEPQAAFQIDRSDHVATALAEIGVGPVTLRGDAPCAAVQAVERIPPGHKIAVADIGEGEAVKKYGVVIGVATRAIRKGSWVHLHCLRSLYDERSARLDAVTGAPTDIPYE